MFAVHIAFAVILLHILVVKQSGTMELKIPNTGQASE